VSHYALCISWQIFASFLLDLVGISSLVLWILYGKSFDFVIALFLFYLTRAIMQNIYILPFPEDFYWEYPGFPSILNMYGRQSDFFWSGHVGLMVLGC
jgi:hypothetical protein